MAVCATAGRSLGQAADWQKGEGFLFKELTLSKEGRPGFTSLSTNLTGIHFINRISKDRYTTNQIYLNGSGVAAGDYDGDGLCDLFFCGLDSENKLYRNLGNWKFEDVSAKARVRGRGIASTGAVFADVNGNGRLDLIINSVGQGTWVLLNAGKDGFRAIRPINPRKGGMSMALADVDSDGDVDLFVGGMANHSDSYLNISSYLFLNSGDDFELTDTGRALNHIGSVTGAVFTDVDNDRDPDLLLARRWNSPLLLINDQGNFTDQTEEWGLSELKGLWHGVSTGDFNNDGRMDFIMTNLGKNNKYTRYLDQEIWLHLGDFNGDGISEGVESIVDPFLQKRVPMRDLDTLSKVMPWVHDMFPSYHAFGQAPIETLLGPVETPPVILKLNTLDTSIFLNLGNRFARKNLPSECQFTPAMGCSVSDFDGDGNEDIYLAQNFFDVERETSRHDAGLGQVLLGNGNGEFRALTRLQSGVAALGQARACVVSDFNGDGRVDIATTQNNDRTLVYLNQGGQFGLRVFLVGTQKNPTAVGATLTLISEGNSGPKREIRLGSGYLSQDGLGQVFTTADKESVLRVQWPSGDSAEYKLPDTAKTITISEKGGIHVVQ